MCAKTALKLQVRAISFHWWPPGGAGVILSEGPAATGPSSFMTATMRLGSAFSLSPF